MFCAPGMRSGERSASCELCSSQERAQAQSEEELAAIMVPRILIIGDDAALRALAVHCLRREGMHVDTVEDVQKALRQCLERELFEYNLVVLDTTLPGVDGITLCRELRAKSQAPIIMLGATDDETSVVVCLEVGADDYLAKPFSPRELVSRMRAYLRRQRRNAMTSEQQLLKFPGLRVDLLRRQVWARGASVKLTAAQFKILTLLASHPGRVYSREQIMEPIWGKGFPGNSRAADVHIQNIRQKIEPDPTNPRYIQTVRGTGYRFAEL